MPRVNVEKSSFTFVKGLVTEASPLNFPEDASLDEENFELRRDGSRRRRLGVDYEPSFVKSSAYAADQVTEKKISRHRWDSPGLVSSLTFEVVRVGETLYFYDISATGAVSANEKSFTVDLNTFIQPNASGVGDADLDAVSGFGSLFVVSDELEPFYIEYDEDTDTITTTQVDFQIRDFEGVDDGLEIEERPSTLTDLHKYNLRNQGWPLEFRTFNNTAGSSSTVGDPIERTNVEIGVYPSNADIMNQFRDTSADQTATVGAFNPFQMSEEGSLGNTNAPKGHFIIDPFLDNKTSVSGIDVSAQEKPLTGRPTCITFFAGRVFYGLGSRMYFSQIISEVTKSGRCYQEQDPTAEDINELLDNDGGVLFIPDAGNIRALEVFRGSVIVYAENGVWAVGGAEGVGFTATGFQVNQVSDAVVRSPRNVRRVGDGHLAIAADGIYITRQEEVSLAIDLQNITENTIQTYYNSISEGAKANSSIVYDARDRKVYWIHNNTDGFAGDVFPQQANAILGFDLPLGAFFKYTISPLTTGSPYITGGFIGGDIVTAANTENVVDSAGALVQDSSLDQVVAAIGSTVPTNGSLKLIAMVPSGANYVHTFAELNNSEFLDWESEDSVGADYTSFLETGYIVEGDIARNKGATYIITAMEQTETAFVDNGSGGVTFDAPSGCLMQSKWGWANSAVSNKYGTAQQIYRFRRPFIAGAIGDPFDYGQAVIVAKSKIRGWGKALHLRFESESGKDARILGWQLPLTISQSA